MRTNVKLKPDPVLTAEGGAAIRITPEKALRRSVLACLLWEDNAYEDGFSIADRIAQLVSEVAPEKVAALAVEAREVQHLRHVPLLLTSALAGRAGGKLVEDTVARVIQRADELAEFLSVHAGRNGVAPDKVKPTISAAIKRGLARAFLRFDEYQLAKYDRSGAVRLRDVMFLTHPKPDTPEREALWKRLASDELATPDTWEVQLSGGADKRETFERLISEGNLGYLALLRNLRNMATAGCDRKLVENAIETRKNGAHRVLPFRFVAAARAAPQFERSLDRAMVAGFAQMPKLRGRTVLVVDVSGSMQARMSSKSDLTRLDTAAALAAIIMGQAEDPVVYATAGSDAARVHKTAALPPRQGMAMVDAVNGALRTMGGGGIFLKQCLSYVEPIEKAADRVIVITDEQDCDVVLATRGYGGDRERSLRSVKPFGRRNYLLNVSNEKNGIGYGDNWTHIDGFSESVVRYMIEAENERDVA